MQREIKIQNRKCEEGNEEQTKKNQSQTKTMWPIRGRLTKREIKKNEDHIKNKEKNKNNK